MAFFKYDRVGSRLNQLRGPGVTCLRNRMEVTFPRNNPGQEASMKRIEQEMAKVFGGTTSTRGDGCWVDPEGRMECEPVTTVASSHDCADKAAIRGVLALAGTEAQRHNQQTVAVRGSQRFYIVPPAVLREEAPRKPLVKAIP